MSTKRSCQLGMEVLQCHPSLSIKAKGVSLAAVSGWSSWISKRFAPCLCKYQGKSQPLKGKLAVRHLRASYGWPERSEVAGSEMRCVLEIFAVVISRSAQS